MYTTEIKMAFRKSIHEGNRKNKWGVNDHPDRAMNGQQQYNLDEYNPYEYSKKKLCDHWSE